jgi:hypothetical protein
MAGSGTLPLGSGKVQCAAWVVIQRELARRHRVTGRVLSNASTSTSQAPQRPSRSANGRDASLLSSMADASGSDEPAANSRGGRFLLDVVEDPDRRTTDRGRVARC